MKIMMIEKETNQEVVYNNAIGYDTHGAIETEKGLEAVVQIVFDDFSTATFTKNNWDLFVLKRV